MLTAFLTGVTIKHMSNRITERDSSRMQILALTGRYTPQEIATYFNGIYTPEQVIRHLTNKDPESKQKLKREKSRGAVILKDILSKIFKNVSIEEEYHLGQRLKLDFHIGEPYHLGFEFDGVQHFKKTDFLHSSDEDFEAGRARDSKKEDLCKGRGLNLVRFSYQDEMTEDLVRERISECGYGSGQVKPGFETSREKLKQKNKAQAKLAAERKKEKRKEYRDSDLHEKSKQRQRDARKQQYKKQKEWMRVNRK